MMTTERIISFNCVGFSFALFGSFVGQHFAVSTPIVAHDFAFAFAFDFPPKPCACGLTAVANNEVQIAPFSSINSNP